MFWIKRLLEDRQAAPIETPRLFQSVLRPAESGKIVYCYRNIRMLWPEQFFFHCQCASVEIFGLIHSSCGLAESAEIVEIDYDFVMLRSNRSLEYRQSPAIQSFCLFVLPLCLKNGRQCGDVGGCCLVVLTNRFL